MTDARAALRKAKAAVPKLDHRLWENLVSLYLLQIFTYVLPLVTLPFLTRVLGTEYWGELALAEAYANYVSLVIEYGFGLSGSRDVAQNQSNPSARSQHLSGILGAQVILSCIMALATVVATLFVPAFSRYRSLLPLAFAMALTRALMPAWYFQGMERMRVISALNVLSGTMVAALTLIFVRSGHDLWIPLALRTAAGTFCTATSLLIAYREIPFIPPTLAAAKGALQQGFSVFLFKSVISLYTSANVILLGMLASATTVAFFAGAEKLAKAAINAIGPIPQAFYPRINALLKHHPQAAARVAKTSAYLTIGLGLALGAVLALAAPLIVRLLLGSKFVPSIATLRILAFLPPLIAASNALGIQWMLSLRLDAVFARICFLAGAVNVGLALWLVPKYAQLGMAASVVVAEAIVTAAVIFVLHHKGLSPWRKTQPEVVAL